MDRLKPGMHPGVPFEDYCADSGINFSSFKDIRISPRRCRFNAMNDTVETESLLIGHATHTAVLEPELYNALYAVYPKADMIAEHGHPNSNAYKKAKAYWEAEHSKHIHITDAQHDQAQAIAKAVKSHPLANDLLHANKGSNELTLIDSVKGHRVKGRIDRLTNWENWTAIVDLKTIAPHATHKLDHMRAAKQVVEYGYHLQMAWYAKLLNLQHKATRLPIWVFVENDKGHDVVVYALDDAQMEDCFVKVDAMFNQFVQCLEESRWPGFSNHMETLTLPDWAF